MPRVMENNFLRKVEVEVQDNKLLRKTTSLNDDLLENNQKHRNNETLRVGDAAPFNPKGAEIVYVMQVPMDDWAWFRNSHRELYMGIHSKNHLIRESSAAKIRELHPEWFVTVPRAFVAMGS